MKRNTEKHRRNESVRSWSMSAWSTDISTQFCK